MVSDIIKKNAVVLNIELDWLYQVLDTRLKLHFEHECEYQNIFEIAPPELDGDESVYSNFVCHYELSGAERIAFLLSLVPHIRPQMLDVFFTKNSKNDQRFTEFGGRTEHGNNRFLPTGETALFILAGDDLEKRLSFYSLFEAEHIFARHNILAIENVHSYDPYLSGYLTLSKEIIELVTTGTIRKPMFGLGFPAKLIETELEWADLVLDSHTMNQVLEIKIWIEHGDVLLNDLGLGRKLKPGYRSLFYGHSGTGKTMTASLLGKVTNRDVYRIDLSTVVSKYIGETEKNLEKIFQKAEHKNWILFFDEAEALFGKRTKIKDAHDRFANQEVSYLLQRVEDYAGVVILASNLKANLDEAFTRRFQSIIHFPMPKENERHQLWKGAFSEKTQLDKKIDLSEVSVQYQISGGMIMNVVRYATLMALRKKRTIIAWDDFRDGLRREYQKEGKTF